VASIAAAMVWINKNRDCLPLEVRNERKDLLAALKGMFGVVHF